MKKLSEFGAVNIRDTPMNQGRDKNDKIRFLFEIDDREKALACYKFFNNYYQKTRNPNKNKKEDKKDKEKDNGEEADASSTSDFNLKELMKIYLQKEEHIFVKYADEEAEIYEQMQELERAQREKQNDDRRKRRQTEKDQARNQKEKDRAERE